MMTREERLLEILRMLKEGKSNYKIRRELKKQGVSVSRDVITHEVKMINRINELVEQRYSANKIEKQLRNENFRIRRRTLQKIIRQIRPAVKREKKKRRFLCVKYIEIKHCGSDTYIQYILEKLDKPVAEIYEIIEDYEFMHHSVYDDVVVDFYISDKKEDEKYRLCNKRLKSMYWTIFRNCVCLRLDQITDITDELVFEFKRNTELIYRERCYLILKKIMGILSEKEILEWRDVV